MKTEQEQRRAIRQILFDANDICQATPCENEYCIYHGDYRCYDNVIVDKLIRAGYGDVSEYKSEIEQLKSENEKLKTKFDDLKKLSDWKREEIKILKAEVNKGCDNCETIKQGQVDVLKELKKRTYRDSVYYPEVKYEHKYVHMDDIDEMIEELEK